MLSSFAVLTAILLLLTLLPLSRIKHWLVRGLDFPRLQLAVLSGLLLVVQLTTLDITQGASQLLIVLNLGCLAVQGWWIWPYTRLHRTEVPLSKSVGNDSQTVSIMTANVLMTNRNAPALIKLVQQYKPDVLVTLESDLWWQQQLDRLSIDYPHSIKCPLDNLYGMHVYSRLPLHNGAVQFLVEPDVPSIHAEVELTSGMRVVMHFVHPAPPSPTENESSSERDAELLVLAVSVAQCKQPLIVTGDLNDVAWSETTRLFRKVSGLLDPRIGRGMFNSFHAAYPFIRWPLDHLFHSSHFSLQKIARLPNIGSDHFPLLMTLRLEGQTTAEQTVTLEPDDMQLVASDLAEQAVSPEQVHRPERAASTPAA
jgi:endonuclease/exonuclease/phosphatase (EEP) superfamily protein YafD